jgi:hypothetical protein
MVSTRRQVRAKQPQPQQHHQQENDPVTPKKKATPKKNLVTAAKPLKSPDLYYPSAKQTSAVLAGDNESVSSDTSSSSARPGIPFFVQKQLAHDIEASGGINAFKKGNEHALAALCNKTPDVYGKRADKLREQLRKKVNRWSALARDGLYTDKVLNKFGVKSWATLSAERRQLGKKNQSAATWNELLPSSDSSSESSGSDSEESRESSSSDKSVKTDKTPSTRQKRTEEVESYPPSIVQTRTEVKMSVRSPSNPLPRNTSKYQSCSLLLLLVFLL